MSGDEPATRVGDLHARVDEEAGALHRAHAARLQCRRGCSACCVDGISVFDVEAEPIRRHHADLLESCDPHPEGMCAFLDGAGACRIYAHRPYVCRTQGLPLRWLEERDGVTVELRDICHLNESGNPVEELDPEDCWTLGPVEGALAQIQADTDGDELRRVSLRDLFSRTCSTGDAEPG